MKNKYLGFYSGFATLFIYTAYDDHKQWNDHKQKMSEHIKKMSALRKENKGMQFSK